MEYQALYRQFRPQNFDEIVEQKAPVATLRKTVLSGKIGHAYLFCGQRGTGKTSIARVFARAMNCENKINGNPCNQCPTCKGILDGSLMDVIEIDAASNRSIDNIRSICEEVGYAPSRAPHKVYIIDEVHMITTEAFNALLKTLEEPPEHAVFLFATTEPHQIPATILSRCQRFDFRRISTDAIIKRLRYICDHEKINATDDALSLIASMSDGAMRDAISFLDQAAAMASGSEITPESIEEMTGTVNIDFIADFAEILISGKFDQLPFKCKELSDSGRDFIQFTLDLADYFRNLMIIRVVPNPTQLITASNKTLKRMYEIANTTNSPTLVTFVSSLSKIVSDLKWSPSVRTSFEISMLRLCGRKLKAEEAPLVIPDFPEKQAQAAKEISSKTAAILASPAEPVVKDKTEEPKTDVVKTSAFKIPEVKTEPPKAEEPAKATEPKVEEPKPEEPKSEEIKTETPADEKKEEPTAEIPPVEEPKKTSIFDLPKTSILGDLPSLNSPFAKKSEEKKEDVAPIPPIAALDPVPSVSPVEAPAAIPVAAPVVEANKPQEEELAPEDQPMDNQIGIFANLSDSILDDLDMDSLTRNAPPPLDEPSYDEAQEDEEEEQEESYLQAPTGVIGETRRSALSEAVDASPIVVAKTPVVENDPQKIWLEIKSKTREIDNALGLSLEDAALKFIDDGAYVIISSNDSAMARTIGTNPNFKRVTGEIKYRIEGIARVFICTPAQYANVERKKMQEQQNSVNTAADDFMRGLGASGINTEIHFGDD